MTVRYTKGLCPLTATHSGTLLIDLIQFNTVIVGVTALLFRVLPGLAKQLAEAFQGVIVQFEISLPASSLLSFNALLQRNCNRKQSVETMSQN